MKQKIRNVLPYKIDFENQNVMIFKATVPKEWPKKPKLFQFEFGYFVWKFLDKQSISLSIRTKSQS